MREGQIPSRMVFFCSFVRQHEVSSPAAPSNRIHSDLGHRDGAQKKTGIEKNAHDRRIARSALAVQRRTRRCHFRLPQGEFPTIASGNMFLQPIAIRPKATKKNGNKLPIMVRQAPSGDSDNILGDRCGVRKVDRMLSVNKSHSQIIQSYFDRSWKLKNVSFDKIKHLLYLYTVNYD